MVAFHSHFSWSFFMVTFTGIFHGHFSWSHFMVTFHGQSQPHLMTLKVELAEKIIDAAESNCELLVHLTSTQ